MKNLANVVRAATSVNQDRWIGQNYAGKQIKIQLANGTKVFGKFDFAANAGFNGIEVHVILADGTRRVAPITRAWVR